MQKTEINLTHRIRLLKLGCLLCSFIVIFCFAALRFGRAAERTTEPFDNTSHVGLYTNREVTQIIQGREGRLNAFAVRFGTYDRLNRGRAEVAFFENDQMLGSWTVAASDLPNNDYQEFRFARAVQMKKKNRYTISVSRAADDPYCDELNDMFALWTSQGGKKLYYAGDRLDNSTLCYRLSFADNVLYKKILFIFLPLYGLICLAVVFFCLRNGLERLSLLKLAAGCLLALLLTESLTGDLLKRINTKVVMQSFAEETQTVDIAPSKEWTSSFTAGDTVSFSSVCFALTNDSAQHLHIRLQNMDTGEIYADRDVSSTQYLAGGPTGRLLQLSAKEEQENLPVFPEGNYAVTFQNLDTDRALSICTTEGRVSVQLIRSSGMGFVLAGVCFLLLICYYLCVLGLIARDKASPDRFFLVSAAMLGVLYLILLLPWSVPDSNAHFPAAYRFSSWPAGAKDEWQARKEDADVYDQLWEKNPDMKGYLSVIRLARYGSMSGGQGELPAHDYMKYYSVLNYIPLIIGLKAGRLLGLNTVWTIYLGRFLMLLAYILLCWRAICMTPIGKSVFAGLALLPVSLMVSSGFSYDGMVLIASLCFLASLFRLLHRNAGGWILAECMLWAAVLGGVKGGGYLLLLVLCFLPAARYSKKGIVFMIPVIAAGLLSVLLFDVILPTDALFQLGEVGTGKLSTSFAIEHPLQYICMMARAYLDYADILLFGMGGRYLSWGQDTIPAAVIAGLYVLTGLQSVLEKDQLSLGKNEKWILTLTVALTVFITPAMLLSWTKVGSPRIEGLQGRYFLPVLPLIFFILTKYRLPSSGAGRAMKKREELHQSCYKWIALLSCIGVYYMLRLYLTC